MDNLELEINSFDPSDNRFQEITNAISSHYPVGVPFDSEKYPTHPNYLKFSKILGENIFDKNTFESKWKSFDNRVASHLRKRTVGTTLIQPSYSSFAVIQENKSPSCNHYKELHFAISLIGKFYTIYGMDTTSVLINNEHVFLTSNVLTCSPEDAYEESFNQLQELIRQDFPKFKFIPRSLGQLYYPNLHVRYVDDQHCTIHMALFNNLINRQKPPFFYGNRRYGMDEWIDTSAKYWTGYPPS